MRVVTLEREKDKPLPMKSYETIFSEIEDVHVVVVGDTMLDHYLQGDVKRISPEAPVPVLRYQREDHQLGGAANVAANLQGLGIQTHLIAVVGEDSDGDTLIRLAEATLSTAICIRSPERPTTLKTRVINSQQQLLRIDREDTSPISSDCSSEVIRQTIRRLDSNPKPRALVLSDYNKGVLTASLSQTLIKAASERAIPVYVDPKSHDIRQYHNASMLTPNRSELEDICGHLIPDRGALKEHAGRLRKHLQLDAIVVTLGSDGLLFIDNDRAVHYPAKAKEVFDVSGAGDTVLAAIVAAKCSGQSDEHAMTFANACAAAVVQRKGTTPITRGLLEGDPHLEPSRIQPPQRVERKPWPHALNQVHAWHQDHQSIVFTNGCFDLLHIGHIELLKFAKAQGDRLVVGLNSDESVRRLKGHDRPIVEEQERVELLRALHAVDLVMVFDEETPLALIEMVNPGVLVKGGDYENAIIVGREHVEQHGGKVILCPTVPNRSTTKLVSALKN